MQRVTQINDLPRQAQTIDTVKVHGPQQCPQCDATLAFLKDKTPAEKVELKPETELYTTIVRTLGYRQAPVVFVEIDGKTYHWGGHRIDLLLRLNALRTQAES